MFHLKVLGILAVAIVTSGTDLDTAYELMACAREAILDGVPELGIPSHDPFVAFKNGINWHGDIGLASATINITNLTWAGLPQWNLTGIQMSPDTAPYAAFEFILYWKWMQIDGQFKFHEHEIIFDQEQEGNFSVEFNHTSWIGSINVTKSGATPSGINGSVTELDLDWVVKDINVTFTGLDELDEPIEDTLQNAMQFFFDNKLYGKTLGEALKYRLNSAWWESGKIWDLVAWCESNKTTKAFNNNNI